MVDAGVVAVFNTTAPNSVVETIPDYSNPAYVIKPLPPLTSQQKIMWISIGGVLTVITTVAGGVLIWYFKIRKEA